MHDQLFLILQKHYCLSAAATEKLLHDSDQAGVRWAWPGQSDYPRLWDTLEHKPPLLCYLGEPVWNHVPLLSVVGSRTPMAELLQWMNRELGEFLRHSGWGVISGGARGVDQWSHRLALDNRAPTVCVLPSGILNPYPFGQQPLWDRILKQGGALMSTFGLQQPMRKHAFHIRNRWIAGLGWGCFVVEANRRSGSSLTAQLAREIGRDVCTLPVSPMSTQGLANLDLLTDGAMMLRDHQDLNVFVERAVAALGPTLFQRSETSEQEQSVDQPKSDPGWQPSITRDTFGADIKNPI